MTKLLSTVRLIILGCCFKFLFSSNVTTDLSANLYELSSDFQFSSSNATNLTLVDFVDDLNTEGSVRNYRQDVGPWVKHSSPVPVRHRAEQIDYERNERLKPEEFHSDQAYPNHHGPVKQGPLRHEYNTNYRPGNQESDSGNPRADDETSKKDAPLVRHEWTNGPRVNEDSPSIPPSSYQVKKYDSRIQNKAGESREPMPQPKNPTNEQEETWDDSSEDDREDSEAGSPMPSQYDEEVEGEEYESNDEVSESPNSQADLMSFSSGTGLFEQYRRNPEMVEMDPRSRGDEEVIPTDIRRGTKIKTKYKKGKKGYKKMKKVKVKKKKKKCKKMKKCKPKKKKCKKVKCKKPKKKKCYEESYGWGGEYEFVYKMPKIKKKKKKLFEYEPWGGYEGWDHEKMKELFHGEEEFHFPKMFEEPWVKERKVKQEAEAEAEEDGDDEEEVEEEGYEGYSERRSPDNEAKRTAGPNHSPDQVPKLEPSEGLFGQSPVEAAIYKESMGEVGLTPPTLPTPGQFAHNRDPGILNFDSNIRGFSGTAYSGQDTANNEPNSGGNTKNNNSNKMNDKEREPEIWKDTRQNQWQKQEPSVEYQKSGDYGGGGGGYTRDNRDKERWNRSPQQDWSQQGQGRG